MARFGVGMGFALLGLFSEIACASLEPESRPVRVCACVRLSVTVGSVRDRVCFGFTRLWRVCLCVCSVACVTGAQSRFCLWRVCPKMTNESSPIVSAAPVKFSGKYAGISTDVYAFLTTLCGVSGDVALKVATDAASSVGRAMAGVTTEVSFGRMTKDTLANIKETATRKGVSVNEFPLQIAYLAEKTRKFCFENRVKVSNVELPESLRHYLLDCAK